MIVNIHAIALRTVKYSDSKSIVTLWTRELGRLSVAVSSGRSREASRLRALLMPLGAFEAVARTRAGSDIATVSDVRPLGVPLSADPLRGMVALFLADFLTAVLRESAPDNLLSDFLFGSICELGAARGTALANFHLYFLYRLGRFLGIEPDDGTYAPGRYFDMREGRFTVARPLHQAHLEPAQAEAVRTLSRLSPRALAHIRLSRDVRNRMLDGILEYYTLHLAPVNSLSSLDVVRAVLS